MQRRTTRCQDCPSRPTSCSTSCSNWRRLNDSCFATGHCSCTECVARFGKQPHHQRLGLGPTAVDERDPHKMDAVDSVTANDKRADPASRAALHSRCLAARKSATLTTPIEARSLRRSQPAAASPMATVSRPARKLPSLLTTTNTQRNWRRSQSPCFAHSVRWSAADAREKESRSGYAWTSTAGEVSIFCG